jgi:hypothetical protein
MSYTLNILRKLQNVAQFIGIYFVSFVLIAFAISKFFNAQFQIYHYSGYMPLNEISPFTHAWSFFGRSYNYNLFLGIAEFLAAVFILFARTRLTGLLMALAIYTNILIIDIEFDVKNALDHVIVELAIILFLLIPFLKHLKKFFWDLTGTFENQAKHQKKIFSVYIPFAFLILVSGGFIWETSSALESQDKIIGEYRLKEFIIDNDTANIKGGKYTRVPMLFFEFGNTFILSINDSTYWGDYFTNGDSVRMILDKRVYNVKRIEGILNRSKGTITGITNNRKSIYLHFIKTIEK